MTNGKNDVEELEELLTELEGQGAFPVGAYSEDDDAPTQQMEAPLGDQEWMVQLAPLDRRMMSGDQVRAELASGNSIDRDTLVWRGGMSDWTPISRVDELSIVARAVNGAPPSAPLSERRPAPLPPVPMPPRVGAGLLGAPLPPVPLPPVPLPPVPAPPSAALGLPRPTPPVGLPGLHSAFNASPVPPSPVTASPVQQLALNPAFQVPPAAAAPSPAPPVFGASPNNTARPVAVDFGEIAPSTPARPLRTVLASGAAALLTVIVTVYALSQGGVFESGVEVSAEGKEGSPSVSAPVEPAAKPAAATPDPGATEAQAPEAQASEARVAEAKAESEASAAAKGDAPAQAEASVALERRPSTRETPGAPGAGADDSSKSEAPAARVAAAATEPAPAAGEAASAESQASAPVRVARMLEARRKARGSAAAGDADKTEPVAAKARRSRAKASGAEGEAAAVVAASDVDSDEAPKDADKPGSTFDRDAAKVALDGAANQAKNCRPQGGPSGSGSVQVRYEPSGKVGAVSILTPKFDNTTAGSCVVMVFKRASIPAFSGAPSVVLNKNFEIP